MLCSYIGWGKETYSSRSLLDVDVTMNRDLGPSCKAVFSYWLLLSVRFQVLLDGVCFFMFLFILFLIKEVVTQKLAIFCYLRGPLFCWSLLLLVPVFLSEQCASDGVDSILDSKVCCVSWPGQSKHCILLTPVIGDWFSHGHVTQLV